MHSTTTNAAQPLPHPAGAHHVTDWDDQRRYFETRRIIVPITACDVAVWTAGFQHADGRITREVCVSQLHQEAPITPQQARQIARALMASADAVDRWQIGEGVLPPDGN